MKLHQKNHKPGNEGQLRVDYMQLSELKPARRNPKRHNLDTVLASIERFGYVSPMILDERTGCLVAGHGRLDSLKKAKAEGASRSKRNMLYEQ